MARTKHTQRKNRRAYIEAQLALAAYVDAQFYRDLEASREEAVLLKQTLEATVAVYERILFPPLPNITYYGE